MSRKRTYEVDATTPAGPAIIIRTVRVLVMRHDSVATLACDDGAPSADRDAFYATCTAAAPLALRAWRTMCCVGSDELPVVIEALDAAGFDVIE